MVCLAVAAVCRGVSAEARPAGNPFGKCEDADLDSLIGGVAGAAIADAGIAEAGDHLLGRFYRKEGDTPAGFAGLFGKIPEGYFQQSDAMAAIAARNHRNGMDNPYARMRRDLNMPASIK